jgi:hypothetical protein
VHGRIGETDILESEADKRAMIKKEKIVVKTAYILPVNSTGIKPSLSGPTYGRPLVIYA